MISLIIIKSRFGVKLRVWERFPLSLHSIECRRWKQGEHDRQGFSWLVPVTFYFTLADSFPFFSCLSVNVTYLPSLFLTHPTFLCWGTFPFPFLWECPRVRTFPWISSKKPFSLYYPFQWLFACVCLSIVSCYCHYTIVISVSGEGEPNESVPSCQSVRQDDTTRILDARIRFTVCVRMRKGIPQKKYVCITTTASFCQKSFFLRLDACVCISCLLDTRHVSCSDTRATSHFIFTQQHTTLFPSSPHTLEVMTTLALI